MHTSIENVYDKIFVIVHTSNMQTHNISKLTQQELYTVHMPGFIAKILPDDSGNKVQLQGPLGDDCRYVV